MEAKQHILVTGATGFIGTLLCHVLVKHRYRVYGLSRTCSKGIDISPPESDRFHLIAGDVRYLDSLQDILRPYNFNVVVHLAAFIPNNNEDETCFETNVIGTYNILSICQKYGIRHFIYASSKEVYGLPLYLPVDENHPKKPENFYGFTKLQGENLCEFFAYKHKVKTVILRYSGVFGPGKNRGAVYNFFQSAFRNESPHIVEGGNQTKDFVYIGDVVDGTIKALKKVSQIYFEVYNIGGGEQVKVYDMARSIYNLIGSDIKIGDNSTSALDRFYLDISRARKALQYSPRPLEEALIEMSASLKTKVKT